MDQERIRNFSIIAHIDHGKSTLADRILELTHAVSSREMRAHVLDTMELERERGITIKAQAVRVLWKGHQLNLIDTPGHVDFTYEVSRSLAACEGALLVVDASQGIEAQTLANAYLAIENDLEIVPAVNKIDLPQALPDEVAAEVSELVGEASERVLRLSAKTGVGVEDVRRLRVGDTVTAVRRPAADPLPGYKDVKPMVFAGLFPTDSDEYPELRDALERLKLNDAALFYEPETSQALGFGFRCGFLGLLHMEIVRERLEREFDLDLLVTAPNVAYRVKPVNGEWVEVHTPADLSGFRPGNLARVDILVGGEPVDALSLTIHRDFAYEGGKLVVEKLREGIPRQMFDVAIQAASGARVIPRETVKARRKDVLAKC